MNIFYRRPLLMALTVFIIFDVIFSCCNELLRRIFIFPLITATILALTSLLILLILKRKSTLLTNLSACLFACLAALVLSINFFDIKLAKAESFKGEHEVVAVIDECTYQASYTSVYNVSVLKINGEKAGFNAEFSSASPTDFQRGEIIFTNACFSSFSENNYGFNERKNNISNNILAYAEFENAEVIGYSENTVKILFANMRDAISKRINKGFGNSSGLINALLIGDRNNLDRQTSLNYRRLGISHILSISGSHFNILLGTAAFFLSAIGLGKKKIYMVLIPFALFYMGLTGFSESVCRAGIMSIIAYSGFIFGRNKDSFTSLAISVSLILLISPHTVLSTSLWLSFISTFTILFITELFGGAQKYLSNIKIFGKAIYALLLGIVISVFISFSTMPIVAAIFGEISIASPIANLFIVPLFSILLYLLPLGVMFSGFKPIAMVFDGIIALIEAVCGFICGNNNLLVSLKYPFVLPVSVFFVVCMLILIALPLRRKKLILLPPVLCICLLAVNILIFNNTHANETRVTYFTEGDSDGIVITDSNKTLCIDISAGYSSSARRSEQISDENLNPEIGAYMFTHYHSRHISMFSKLCTRTRVQAVYLPIVYREDVSLYAKSIADIASEHKTKIIWFNYNEPTEFYDSEITVFEPIYISRSTHPIINMQIASKDKEILYLGSSFAEGKFEYKKPAKDAEYLIFGQHNPVAKKPFSADTEAIVILGNEMLKNLYMGDRSDVILTKNSKYEILLK